jgi:DNA (cytosine-5)-methyltransferase 1
MEKLTHLSLFSGIGGIDLAAEAAGFETVCQCEWADYPNRVLEKRWPSVPRFRDITTLTKEAFIEKTRLETVTLISGGFPCQPFSAAGKRRGFADERYLWPEMCRVIGELRPRWVLGENVAGFINMGLDKTILDLERANYAVRVFVLPACAVGAWHERKRTFIIGFDVSDPHCLRYERGREIYQCCGDGKRRVQKDERERHEMDAEAVGGGVLPDADGFGRLPLDAKTRVAPQGESNRQPVGTDGARRNAAVGQGGTQSALGGMADGLPPGMDGRIIWAHEPDGVERMTEQKTNRAERLKSLGNAVVPQQVFPVLKYIADIETGRCRDWYFTKRGDET